MTTQRQTLPDFLSTCRWLKALSVEELQRVASEVTEEKVPSGGYVCRRGEDVTSWIGVVDGLVKMSNPSPEGKRTTLTGVPTGEWFGEGSLLKDAPRRDDILALRDSRIVCMPRVTFNRLFSTNSGFNRFLCKYSKKSGVCGSSMGA